MLKSHIVPRRSTQGGLSLIELMMAIAISLIILLAMTYIFVGNSQSRSETERANQELENGRYAMQVMSDDLQMAGYWAEFNIGLAITNGSIVTPANLPDPCIDASTTARRSTMAAAMPLAVQGYDQGANIPATCSFLGDLRPNTDILVVRRVSGCVAGPTANADCPLQPGAPYFQASRCNNFTELNSTNVTDQYRLETNTNNLNRTQRDCVTAAAWHQFLTHIYFIANNSRPGDGIPTLMRAELGANGWADNPVPIAQGVENIQIEYGIDTNGDRIPDVFNADPVNDITPSPAPMPPPSNCTAAPCILNYQNVTAVQINLLVRNPSQSMGYTDTKTYSMGLAADGSANNVGPFNDQFKRHVYRIEVLLNNPSIR